MANDELKRLNEIVTISQNQNNSSTEKPTSSPIWTRISHFGVLFPRYRILENLINIYHIKITNLFSNMQMVAPQKTIATPTRISRILPLMLDIMTLACSLATSFSSRLVIFMFMFILQTIVCKCNEDEIFSYCSKLFL